MKYKLLTLIILLILCVTSFTFKVYAIKESDVANDIYDTYNSTQISCGAKDEKSAPLIDNIPESIPKITHIVYLTLLIAVPVVLIILGMLDLFKGIIAQKDDEIKKGQQTFLKRLLAAVLIFFVFTIVRIIVDFAGDSNSGGIIRCAECFIEGIDKCEKTAKK